jgi:hypothetical protein
MVGYRCYVLDAEDHIVQAHDLDCECDAQAEAAAETFLRQDPYHGSVEVWRAARRVARLKREAGIRFRLARHVGLSLRPIGSTT